MSSFLKNGELNPIGKDWRQVFDFRISHKRSERSYSFSKSLRKYL